MTTLDALLYLWRHRPGNEIPALVQDVWAHQWTKGNRPLIVKQKRLSPGKWWLMLSLPPGMTYAELHKTTEAIMDATFGVVELERTGRRISLTVTTEQLKSLYPFAWEYDGKMALPVHLGHSAVGEIIKDLATAPHLLVAGQTGGGKSNLLHVIAMCLLLSREVDLRIIDLKVLEFDYLGKYAKLATDQDEAMAVLDGLNAELDRRLAILKKARVVKIQNFRGHMPYVVLIIDELAELRDKKAQEKLNRLLRLSRAAGMSVVCATQRPSSTIFNNFGDSKALFPARVCFQVDDGVNSRMVLDNDRAAYLPEIPGRCIVQWGRELEAQTMLLPPDDPAIVEPLLAKTKRSDTEDDDKHGLVLPPR